MTKKTTFDRLNIQPFLIEALVEQGFKKPTDIQERVVPGILNGYDIIGQSQTGSGKTMAFLLPILNKIDATKNEIQAVITAPTRELAQQIFQEYEKLAAYFPEEAPITAKTVVGGTDRKRMADRLKNPPHLIIGTPGRINDLVKNEGLNIYSATTLVVDEADQMLDMGFIEDVDQLASRMAETIQMLVFSATIPEKLQPFLKKYMNQPRHVHVSPEQTTAKEIKHVLIPLKHKDKTKLLIEVAKAYNPYLCLIFVNTKKMADEVSDAMSTAGLNVQRLHGDIQPRERKSIMKRIQKAEYQYVVATDLAARGIDIKGISHIINYELPKDLDYYIHRTGRTGRAGMTGIAATIIEPSDQLALQKLQQRKIPFVQEEWRNGEWKEVAVRARKKPAPAKEGSKADGLKPKKVKPGYKKKWAEEKRRMEKQQRRRNK
ncbi:DEAD/DEAH box helicase [Fictibacillus macauensis ZFHKF-1]|uniref:DEAD/DEAH box helicase n=1 Tax=Fictibacillus macauensis ZFHKF-1 TaxID=1196324 RepID=I8UE60_9BACL|nr:DEAD/DEAH box helicase [Fictibacillus macauensis]EIT85195.1 DEAD/DEAH box helicase [Fictibacillus macauensis ZFHKF-1]